MVSAADVEAVWDREMAAIPAWSLVLRWRDVSVDVRGDLAYSGASTIKTFLLEQASLTLSWDQQVTVTPEHVAVGDGVLAHWPLPVTLPLHAVAPDDGISDNTATNVVVDTLGGLEVVNDALADAGRVADAALGDGKALRPALRLVGLPVPALTSRAERRRTDRARRGDRPARQRPASRSGPGDARAVAALRLAGPAPPRRHAVRARGR